MQSYHIPIIAIDGPAGAGKSALAKALAKSYGWSHINTGLLYRAIGFLLEDHELESIGEQRAESINCANHLKSLSYDLKSGKIFFKSQDISKEILTQNSGWRASVIAKSEPIRKLLLPVQRRWALQAEKGCVVEGRDIGTVVFPDALLKIYITASIECRAKRRKQQIDGKSKESLEEIIQQITTRDQQDMERGAAPLTEAKDALTIDTTNLSLERVLEQVQNSLKEKLQA